MYKEFYGFTTFPFALTPDPQFLYPSESYKNCLFYLLYGLERDSGLLVVTGEIGTGKTFLLNTMMQRLDKNTHVASLVHSNLDNLGVLQYASQELKLDIAGQSKAELLINLKKVLRTYEMKNEKAILLIDEAQNLSVDVLEELRLLTNFENTEKKLLQVVLAGQLQLEEKLRLPELAQLSQRIGFSCRLVPMDYDETKRYIETRLAVAGVTYLLFTPQAMKEIFVRSKGTPRVINLICDLALLFGFSEEKREIGPPIIKQVMQELNLYTPEKAGRPSIRQKREATGARIKGFMRSNRMALIAGIAALSLLGAGAILQSELTSGKLREYMTRTVLNPLAALPQSPSTRAQPSCRKAVAYVNNLSYRKAVAYANSQRKCSGRRRLSPIKSRRENLWLCLYHKYNAPRTVCQSKSPWMRPIAPPFGSNSIQNNWRSVARLHYKKQERPIISHFAPRPPMALKAAYNLL